MARPSKSLEARIRDRSFLARRHHELLAGLLVTAKKLRAIQAAYQAASSDPERRALALDFERGLEHESNEPAPARGRFAIAYREAGKSTPLAFREKNR
jgi:hypothetical protein